MRQRLAALERKLAEETAARERLKRELALRDAALNAGTSHFMIAEARSGAWKIEYVNRALAAAHGYEPHELIGQPVKALKITEGLSRSAVELMNAELAAGRPYRAEIEAKRRDGSAFMVGFTSVALRDAHGEISHVVTVAADITSRLDAERKRRELQEQLLSEMRMREQMAVELRLAQKLESVGRLAAGLAHEINTPIQYVSDSVHFLRDGVADVMRLVDGCRALLREAELGDSGKVAQIDALEKEIDFDFLRAEFPNAFARTLEGADRVAALVRAMKEFAHPGASERSPADLNHALETTLAVCRNEYRYVASVTTDLAELPAVLCNISELNQVFVNLIVNAAHGIQDTRKDPSEGQIRIATRQVADSVEITISDNGCGIASENLDKIFDPFFTTKEVGRGTGQGLAIARSIVVEKHRGDIRVQSTVGVGTTFTIVLPIDNAMLNVA